MLCECQAVKDIKTQVGLANNEPDTSWAFFTEAAWTKPQTQTIGGGRFNVGSASLHVALADALCMGGVTEETLWDTKMYATPRNGDILDLRTPLCVRRNLLEPDLLDAEWFHQERLVFFVR